MCLEDKIETETEKDTDDRGWLFIYGLLCVAAVWGIGRLAVSTIEDERLSELARERCGESRDYLSVDYSKKTVYCCKDQVEGDRKSEYKLYRHCKNLSLE